MIYLVLDGRIGNQLFMYAYAKKLLSENVDQTIIVDDTEVLKRGYVNSLTQYSFANTEYVHDHHLLFSSRLLGRGLLLYVYRLIRKPFSFRSRYNIEKKLNGLFTAAGAFFCENGYLKFTPIVSGDVLLYGYYQCDKYFVGIEQQLRAILSLPNDSRVQNYPGLDAIQARNSVCISIKVQHNVGNSVYDVCNDGYWKQAIDYITNEVDNPLFFICSDNVEYVKKNLIDTEKYDTVFQSADYEVHETLAVMGQCKHFIIGNTTFGWWAQFINPSEEKIVVAPSRWMNADMPIDIYQDNWHLIGV